MGVISISYFDVSAARRMIDAYTLLTLPFSRYIPLDVRLRFLLATINLLVLILGPTRLLDHAIILAYFGRPQKILAHPGIPILIVLSFIDPRMDIVPLV